MHRPSVHEADEFLSIDLCAEGALLTAISTYPPDIVFHLAGLMPPNSEEDMHRANVLASQNLVRALSKSAERKVRLVGIGSAAEYLPQSSPLSESSPVGGVSAYGRTKSLQTSALLGAATQNLAVVIARPFNLLGPGLSPNLVAGGLCQQFMSTGRSHGFIAPKGPIDSARDFVDVRDAVDAYWLLARFGLSGQTYNVCSGVGTSIRTVIGRLEQFFNVDVEVRPDYDKSRLTADVVVGDNRKLTELGWAPRFTLDDSLKAMADWTLRQTG